MKEKEFKDIPRYMFGVCTFLIDAEPTVDSRSRVTHYTIAQVKESSKQACLAQADADGIVRYSYVNRKERKAIYKRNIAKAQYYAVNSFTRIRLSEFKAWVSDRQKEKFWISQTN